MTGWSFDPVGGWGVWALAALALAPLLAIRPTAAKPSFGRRIALVGLRAATLVILLLLWIRPALETRTTRKLPGTLVVLGDASRSMSVADAAREKSRYTAMREALVGAAEQFNELAESWSIHGYALGRDVTPLKFGDGAFAFPEEPDSRQTAIGSGLDDVLAREGQQRIVAVVLLSDGAQRAFAPRDLPPQNSARQLAADGVPLYTLCFGQPSLGERADLRLSDLRAPDAVFAEAPAAFEATVDAVGFAHQRVAVKLLWEAVDGRSMTAVDSRRLTIVPGKTRYPVRLSHTPRDAGEYKVTIEVESPPGELVASNNVQSTFVTVLKGGVNILYLAGSSRIGGAPGVEPRFLRQSLASHADLHVEFEAINYRTGEVDLRDRLRQEKFDVLLIGNVDAAGLSVRSWREIALKVESGTGLAMLGGFHSFGPGGFQATPLADVLPVTMGRADRQSFGEPPRGDMHVQGGARGLRMIPVVRGGRVHPIMQTTAPIGGRAVPGDETAVWLQAPTLDGANRLDRLRLKPGAQVVAEADDASRSPLLVLSAWGEGRVAALAVDSTWLWQLGGSGELHRKFWRQLVLWLAKKDETAGQRVWVRLDQRRYQQGSRVDFTLGAEDAEHRSLADAQFEVRVETPEGAETSVRTTPRGKTSSGSFAETDLPGDYRVVVAARRGGETLGAASARFTISDQDVELDQPAAEPLLLKSLAQLTADSGGAALAPEELPDLLARLKEKTKEFEEEVVETRTLWDRWPPLLVFATLLSTEWFLRKRWGMA
jgi:hypothetical protein